MVGDALYEAIVQNDRRYDGRVYIGIRTTGIVCFPSCRSRTPRRDNVEVFYSVAAAVKEGYRPCKRCKPDGGAGGPPDALLALEAETFIRQRFPARVTMAELAQALYVSPRHLARTLKRVWGVGLSERWSQQWAARAQTLLADPALTISEAARRVGTPSAAHFSRRFRRIVGKTPREYRKDVDGSGGL